MKAERDVLTTGDVARLCRVIIRTVIKWYEQGRLPGYRIPGSRARRFTRPAVERFLQAHGLPFDPGAGTVSGARRVLVVDDDGAVRDLVARALEAPGVLEIATASSGWEAGLKTAALHPHLLLLDYRLGDTTGDQVIAAIADLGLRPAPAVVIMSAQLPPGDVQRVLALGAAAFLRKPFALQELRDVVARHAGAPPAAVAAG